MSKKRIKTVVGDRLSLYPTKFAEKILEAELGDLHDQIPQLDLHGFFADQVKVKLESFLFEMKASDESFFRISHGKGEGVLEKQVYKELEFLLALKKIKKHFSSKKYPGGAIVVLV